MNSKSNQTKPMTMYLDSTKTDEALVSSPHKQKITIKSDRLKTPQQLHALASVLIPLLGTVVAIAIASRSGISPIELGLLIGMYVLTVTAISVGFHRQFSHCTFKTHTWVRVILAILGSMACQGPVIFWVSTHRRHHQFSDESGDSHSPYVKDDEQLGFLQGLWHSHVGWTFTQEITNTFLFAKDLLRDPVISKVNQLYYVWVLLGLFIPAILGGILTQTWMGVLSGFLWGGLVRLFLTYQATNSINSITHLFGNRPFDTGDWSRNNIWLAIPTGGEAWHNNHHAFPNSAKFGLSWWQIDLGYWVIRVLEMIGLAWDVKSPTAGMIQAKKEAKKIA
ncbi:acyl-CoA desaturase [Tolypothrix sp. NIES-4075]|uniref:acyl-CoA desaturase n=1 Tax=Tolypothrix sp. NIES-4075 TaxID=2005459 RepID=UPI001F3A9F0F|nr:acyl-CoA desaturase [Tolypothrix sp. NIES-4075]